MRYDSLGGFFEREVFFFFKLTFCSDNSSYNGSVRKYFQSVDIYINYDMAC